MDRMDEDSGSASETRDASQPPQTPNTAQGKQPAPGPPSATGSSSAAQGISKRRRGLGVVTPNACTECRKKRAKCDGQNPCGRCKSANVPCVYEVPVRQSKENLRHEIDALRRQQRSSDSVFAALVRPDLWKDVLERLRTGQSVENISGWLSGAVPAGRAPGTSDLPGYAGGSAMAPYGRPAAAGAGNMMISSPVLGPQAHGLRLEAEQGSPWRDSPFPLQSQPEPSRSNSHPDAMSWASESTRGPPRSRVGSWAESQGQGADNPRYQGMDQALSPNYAEIKVPRRTWTELTSDTGLVQHLLALYFCWEYPTFASLSKEHFLTDFIEGRPRFCSPILVNALLALGCRFSSQPNTRANPDDPYTSGDHFFQESQRLFYLESSHHNLTTIQALGIMSIREASCGRDSESWYYAGQSIRLAIEMGLHQIQDDGGESDEIAVQSATFWGAFALDHAWSLATGSLPQCSCFPHLPPKPGIIDDIEASLWIPYTDNGAPLQRSCEQPSNVRSVYKCFCELSELVHQSLYILHSPGRPLTSRDLLQIYTQYLNWYAAIPEVLRLGHNFTPAVLFAHMYYHFAILLLFRPLIKLRIIGSSITPRDVCIQAADAIQGLLRSYSQLYTLRRTPSFVPYFVLTSSIMHLAIGASAPPPEVKGEGDSREDGMGTMESQQPKLDERVTEAITRGIADLTEMAPCHHFAEQALNILRYLAKKWNIEVDIDDSERGLQSEEDARGFERSTRPVTSSLNFFSPNIAEQDFMCTWGGTDYSKVTTDTGGTPKERSVAGMDNPLFWPFPMQGRPMLPTGPQLKDAGFELI